MRLAYTKEFLFSERIRLLNAKGSGTVSQRVMNEFQKHLIQRLLLATGFTVLVVSGLMLALFQSASTPDFSVASISPDERMAAQKPVEIAKRSGPEQPSAQDSLPRAAAVKKQTAASSGNDKRLIASLKEENNSLRTQLDEILNWILTNFRGKYPLDEGHVGQLSFDPLTADFMLNPDVAEFLRMTPEEQAMVHDAFAYAGSVMDAIEYETMTLQMPTENKVILRVPTFPEEGIRLQDELYGALEATLGVDRFDRLLDVSEEKMMPHFQHFGNASRTVILEVVQDYNGTPSILVKDGSVVHREDGTRQITAIEGTYPELPEEYEKYAAYLPEEAAQ